MPRTASFMKCIPLLSAALAACEVSLNVRDAENYNLCKDATSVAAEAYKVDSERWPATAGITSMPPGGSTINTQLHLLCSRSGAGS